MPQITFIEPSGERKVIDASGHNTLMEVASYNGVEGILAECGGSCACATCHVLIDESFVNKLPDPSEYELEMLQETLVPAQANSRLSCQIAITDQLDGMIVKVAEEQ